MKTAITFFCTFLLISVCAFGQDYIGLRSGNYVGINGTFFNPAKIVDSRYRFDLNLASLSANVGNNQASYNLNDILKSFNEDEITDQLFGNKAGTSSGVISTDVHGPSLMFNAGRKTSVALTTRARVVANVIDMDGKLMNKITNDFNNDASLPYTFSSGNNMRVNVNAWTEYGLSLARVISDKGKHFFKVGVSLKQLRGAGNAYLGITDFSATVNEDRTRMDNYLNNATGKVSLGFSGASLSNFEVSQLKETKSKGFGSDIGLEYEYRPRHEDYKNSNGSRKKDYNKYKFKVGVALLDLGKIKYEKDMQKSGAYGVSITGSQRLYLSELQNVEIEDYKSYFDSRRQFFTPGGSNEETTYKFSLPSTLQLDFDYHLHRGFYINVASQVSIVNKNSLSNNYYNGLTITPRYEGKGIGFYIPVNYNSLTDFNMGVSLRLGPLFVGSGSVLSALTSNSKQADVYVGWRFGFLR